jgi:hypothetical protein
MAEYFATQDTRQLSGISRSSHVFQIRAQAICEARWYRGLNGSSLTEGIMMAFCRGRFYFLTEQMEDDHETGQTMATLAEASSKMKRYTPNI